MLAAVFTLYVLALYGPMICIYILSFQDVRGGLVFPMKGTVAALVRRPVHPGAHRRREGRRSSRSIMLAVIVTILTVVVSFLAGLAFRQRFNGDGVVFYLMIGSLVAPGLVLGIGVGLICTSSRHRGDLVHLGARRAPVLDLAVRRAGDVRGDVALRPRLGGSRARPRRHRAGRRSGS